MRRYAEFNKHILTIKGGFCVHVLCVCARARAGFHFLSKSPFYLLFCCHFCRQNFISQGEKAKAKNHSLARLILWAATVNVQKGRKDNCSQGMLPGTTLDHPPTPTPQPPTPSSLFSLRFMNKTAVKVCPIAKRHFYLFHTPKGTLTINSQRVDGFSTCLPKWISRICDNSIIEVLHRPGSSKSSFVFESQSTAWQLNPTTGLDEMSCIWWRSEKLEMTGKGSIII